jgi:hypothetical protein
MKNNENILDSYFKGELSESELKLIIERGDLGKSEMGSYLHLLAALEKSDEEKTRKDLRAIEQKSTSKGIKKIALLIAVAIMLLTISLFYFLNDTGHVTEHNIDVTKFAFLYPSETNTRSFENINEISSNEMSQEEANYANGDFKSYIEYFEKNRIQLSNFDEPQLRYISSLVATEQYTKVISKIDMVNCKSKSCTQNLEWYQIISLLGSSQNDRALNALLEIDLNEEHPFHTDSKKLIQELSKQN